MEFVFSKDHIDHIEARVKLGASDEAVAGGPCRRLW